MNYLYFLLQASAPSGGGASIGLLIVIVFFLVMFLMIRQRMREEGQAKKGFNYQEKDNNSAPEDNHRKTKDKLSELQRLYEEGVLTQEEYQKAKAKLLGDI